MQATLDTFAIVGGGASATTVNEGQADPNACTIEGTEGAFITNGSAIVDLPANCT